MKTYAFILVQVVACAAASDAHAEVRVKQHFPYAIVSIKRSRNSFDLRIRQRIGNRIVETRHNGRPGGMDLKTHIVDYPSIFKSRRGRQWHHVKGIVNTKPPHITTHARQQRDLRKRHYLNVPGEPWTPYQP